MSYNIAVNDTQRTTLKSNFGIIEKAISSGLVDIISQTEYEKSGRPAVCVIQKDTVSNYRGFTEIHTQTYLEKHFTYPQLRESMICDKLEFTVAVSDHDLSEIIDILKGNKNKGKKRSKCVTHCKFDKPLEVKFREGFTIISGESTIVVFYNPVNRNNANLKISYNPDKVHKQHLDKLIMIIASVTKNRFNKLIKRARITRVDFAIDIVGIHISDLLFNKARTKYHRVYLTSDNVIESIVLGADGYNRIIGYDKLAEQIHRAIESGNDALVDSLINELVRIRIESSMRPYKMTPLKRLCISDYEKLDDCFKNVTLYDERALLNNFYLKEYFTDFKLKGINYVLRTLSRKQKLMMKQQLALVEIEINHEDIKKQQDVLLSRILSRMLSIESN